MQRRNPEEPIFAGSPERLGEPAPAAGAREPTTLAGRALASARRDAAALLIFTLAALLVLGPVLAAPHERILGGPSDNIQYVYITGRMAEAVARGESPFFDPRTNYPDGLPIVATDVPYLAMLAVAPATLALGPVFGYNLLLALCHLLSGYAVYRWTLSLTGSRGAGVIGGLGFALAVPRVLHSLGHPQLVATPGLVLLLWALDRALAAARPGWRALLPLAGAAWLLGGSSQYLLVIGLVSGVCYALLSLIGRPAHLLRHGWAIGLATLSGALAGAAPYLALAGAHVYQPYRPEDVRLWAADPRNFLQPSPLHPLWGAALQALRPIANFGETALYLGAITGGLALLALLWPGGPQRGRARVWLGSALAAAVFALGADLHLDGRPLSPDSPLPLPAAYLSRLPLVSLLRIWPRFGIVTILLVCLLAGLGAARLISALRARRGRRWAAALAATLAALLVIDLLPGIGTATTLTPRPIDRWLAAQPGDFAVAALPPTLVMRDHLTYRTLYGSLYHGKRVPGFGHPYHLTPAYRDFLAAAAGFPSRESVERLRAAGYRYVVLDHEIYNGYYAPLLDEALAAVRRAPGLAIVAELDDATVIGFR